ncbi:putative riboflavin kinase [Rhagoletis pomonella]|uniref:putative riboflavin kinase n=1 Tax=Rhagoletis pomonella TaxID=28610 RepID=UPI00177D8A3E|nr:putative riboflavin kinase [Rhagoletis pomonella]
MCILGLTAYPAKKVFDIAFQRFSLSSDKLLVSRIFRCLTSGGALSASLRSSSSNSALSNSCQTTVIRNSSTFKRSVNKMLNHLPYFASGEIVRGFGRGSSELGIPTANFSLEVVKSLPAAFSLGIYYGWANVDNGEVYKMVMSIGTNPYYDNKEKSMETHIMHKFDGDLYGRLLKVCIVGYLRPECNFESLEALINAIQKDIKDCNNLLDKDEESRQLRHSKFFKANCNDSPTNSTTTYLNGDNAKNGSS